MSLRKIGIAGAALGLRDVVTSPRLLRHYSSPPDIRTERRVLLALTKCPHRSRPERRQIEIGAYFPDDPFGAFRELVAGSRKLPFTTG
jgi:hypothetical protein